MYSITYSFADGNEFTVDGLSAIDVQDLVAACDQYNFSLPVSEKVIIISIKR